MSKKTKKEEVVEIIISDPIIRKQVEKGDTKTFSLKEDANNYASEKGSYSYSINTEDEDGNHLGLIYGVPK